MNSGDAFNKTLTLSAALLTTVLVWAVFLVPGADLVWVTFTFLTSAMLFDVPDFKSRLTLALKMAVYAAAAQFLTGITWQSPFLRIVLLSLFSFFVLKTVSHRQESCIILLVAFLTYSLPGGMIIVRLVPTPPPPHPNRRASAAPTIY